jgi:cytochrome P450
MNDLNDHDLMDPEVQGCPYDYYAHLRAEAPIYRMPSTGFYLVTSFDLCMEVIRQPDLFASGVSPQALRPGGVPQAVLDVYQNEGWMPVSATSTSDPPAHTRTRHVLGRLFTVGSVRALTPYIDGLVNELIDGLAQSNSAEFVREFAHPLPMMIIADQLGVPRQDLPRFKEWTDAIVEPFSMMVSEEREVECARLVVEMQHYFAGQITRAREQTDDKLISRILAMDMGEFEPLNTGELLSLFAIDLLASGNETTMNAISSGMVLLIQQPQIIAEVRDNPELLKNLAEEILRIESPAQGMFREVTEDTEVAGVALKKGELLSLRFGAANRDEAQYPHADRIDLHRPQPGKHLALGIGRHTCIGAALARQELISAFAGLLSCLDNFAFDQNYPEPEYIPSFFGRGLRELRITYTTQETVG